MLAFPVETECSQISPDLALGEGREDATVRRGIKREYSDGEEVWCCDSSTCTFLALLNLLIGDGACTFTFALVLFAASVGEILPWTAAAPRRIPSRLTGGGVFTGVVVTIIVSGDVATGDRLYCGETITPVLTWRPGVPGWND